MIAIAENLNTRNKVYTDTIAKKDTKTLTELVNGLVLAGADMINIQCSLDGAGDEDALPWVAGIVSEISDCAVSLDSRNIPALKKTIPLCKKPPLVNFVSKTEPANQEDLISMVSGAGAALVIRASSGTIPSSLETKIQIIEDLIEAANAADIPNERIYADPSMVHIGGGIGQKHLVNSRECVMLLKELIEPPLNTISWISNISTGLPKTLRKPLEASFLTYMAGAGLDAALVDILDEQTRKAIYLVKAFRDEIVFSKADIT